MKRSGHPRYAALQALAIREKKVHVYGTPDLPRKPVQVFLDAEGNEDGSFVYLLGVLVVEGDSQKMHSFWADGAGPRRWRCSTPSWTSWTAARTSPCSTTAATRRRCCGG